MLATSCVFLALTAVPPIPQERPATILLVTSQKLEKAWRLFAHWKTRLGKSTKVVTVESIATAYEGKDIQAKIRNCVLAHIAKSGTRWVVLGGDSQPDGKGHVPHRETRHRTPMRTALPTDLYYISTRNWDANEDGIYGDWRRDREAVVYGHEDACIARIPVRTPQDVKAYTAKVIAYESRYPEGDFAKRMLYTCPEPGAYPKVRRSWDDYVSAAWKQGSAKRWFRDESSVSEGGDDLPLVPANWVAQLNKGVASKIHMHGHGHLPVWVLANRKTVKASHVRKLENKLALPIITTVSCNTGEFDSKNDPSITECMLREPNGGAVAIVAPSRPGIPVFANRSDFRLMMTEGKLDGTTETMTRFWVHGLERNLTTGEAMAAAKADFTERARKHASFHFIQCELNLLGDPTLDFRAAPPRRPDVGHPSEIRTGEQRLDVKTGIAGATVCLWKGEECYVVVTAGADGVATAKLHPKTAGELLVTVSGPSLNAAASKLTVR